MSGNKTRLSAEESTHTMVEIELRDEGGNNEQAPDITDADTSMVFRVDV